MSILQKFNEGGIFMYFILAFGLLTLALIVERAVVLYAKIKEAPGTFRDQILEFLKRGDYKAAEAHAKATAGATGLGRVVALGCGLRASAAGDEEVQSRMDEKLSTEISSIDRRTGFLAMFGNVATLLGLLGTISGMIQSFAAVANASPADRATMLSKGISEAMNCTAFGLVVAIPALVAFAIFQNKTDRIITELTEKTTQIFNDLVFLNEPVAAASKNQRLSRENAAQLDA
jgi:biopolymer transport protein ExbB/TolQ